MKYTTIDIFEKYIYNDTKKFKMFYRLVYFTYLVLRCLRTCMQHIKVFREKPELRFTSSTTLRY
jgi:hypothetical protein